MRGTSITGPGKVIGWFKIDKSDISREGMTEEGRRPDGAGPGRQDIIITDERNRNPPQTGADRRGRSLPPAACRRCNGSNTWPLPHAVIPRRSTADGRGKARTSPAGCRRCNGLIKYLTPAPRCHSEEC